jgi:hypothetical protein
MPKIIDLTLVWDDWSHGMSMYSLGRPEIEEIIHNYSLENEQSNLFSYLPLEVLRQWVWDVFAREPHEVVIERITY